MDRLLISEENGIFAFLNFGMEAYPRMARIRFRRNASDYG